ncbi:MlaD family protein [Nocardioides panacisoli]|uniref:MCE family protein n=1 Tax=Nocardioides panacisoli TaxID=627624 RepID=A0ABP7HYB7_9ACTN
MLSSRARALVATIVVAVVAAVAAVIGVGALPDVTTARLPGAAGGDHTYPVEARFRDALDLVPNSTVRVADVPVGRVTSIDVGRDDHGYVAVAELEIDDSVDLPAGTVATIRSTSLLGEKYVELIAPAHGSGSLRSEGTIPIGRTTQDVEVEQLLSSLGALLNGGGLQQLATITDEFSKALGGHEQDTRALLEDLDAIVGGLDRGRPALLAALRSTARLNSVLAAQRDVLTSAVDDLDPATGVLAQQVSSLHDALVSLRSLDRRATHVIRASTDATVDDLAALEPVARQVGKVADLIPENITLLVTYPFADTAVPAFSGAYGAVKGSVDIDLNELLFAVAPTPQDSDQPFNPDNPGAPPDDGSADGSDPQGLLPQLGVPDVVGGLLDLLTPRTGGAG